MIKHGKQMEYKQMLDGQIEHKNQQKMYGNMTRVEKQLNKEDLSAWQRYDNYQYSLIPGISHKYER